MKVRLAIFHWIMPIKFWKQTRVWQTSSAEFPGKLASLPHEVREYVMVVGELLL
jgi:hypothetical protein